MIVGFTDPEGARPWFGALLLGYYDARGKLRYAGRAGSGIGHRELKRLYDRLTPLETKRNRRSALLAILRAQPRAVPHVANQHVVSARRIKDQKRIAAEGQHSNPLIERMADAREFGDPTHRLFDARGDGRRGDRISAGKTR